ncbi:MAG: DUF2975 domain-containing protein [Waltera sp.]
MEKRELSEKELREKKLSLAKGTKYLLDFMFYAGILVTISLPLSLKYIGKYLEAVEENYLPAVIIFAILGVLALLLINELRKMFGTVLAENCFVPENVASLRRMGDLSFFIAAMSAVRCVVYLTIAMSGDHFGIYHCRHVQQSLRPWYLKKRCATRKKTT